MIVSHEHQFIFVKTPKTAGTSIEACLSNVAGRDAIVTPDTHSQPKHDPRNWRRLFNPGPELLRKARKGPDPKDPNGSFRATGHDLKTRRAFYDHMSAQLARDRLGRNVWNSYFKFCFVRNPWDQVASLYFYTAEQHRRGFEDWVSGKVSDLWPTWYMYTIADEIAVDFVGRYERLEDDLSTALRHVGLTSDVELPRVNAGFRPTDGTGRPRFTPESSGRVERLFAREIAHFGYVAPSWASPSSDD